METVTQDPAPRSSHPLMLAVRASTRSELLVIGIVLFFYVVISVALAVSSRCRSQA
jgi:hypothetical protein